MLLKLPCPHVILILNSFIMKNKLWVSIQCDKNYSYYQIIKRQTSLDITIEIFHNETG